MHDNHICKVHLAETLSGCWHPKVHFFISMSNNVVMTGLLSMEKRIIREGPGTPHAKSTTKQGGDEDSRGTAVFLDGSISP